MRIRIKRLALKSLNPYKTIEILMLMMKIIKNKSNKSPLIMKMSKQ
jgi:hypothetical protein